MNDKHSVAKEVLEEISLNNKNTNGNEEEVADSFCKISDATDLDASILSGCVWEVGEQLVGC